MTRRTDKPGREHLAAVAVAVRPARPGRAAKDAIAAVAISIDGIVTTYQPEGQSQDGLDAARNHMVGLACGDRLVVVLGLADVGAGLWRELDVVFPRVFDVGDYLRFLGLAPTVEVAHHLTGVERPTAVGAGDASAEAIAMTQCVLVLAGRAIDDHRFTQNEWCAARLHPRPDAPHFGFDRQQARQITDALEANMNAAASRLQSFRSPDPPASRGALRPLLRKHPDGAVDVQNPHSVRLPLSADQQAIDRMEALAMQGSAGNARDHLSRLRDRSGPTSHPSTYNGGTAALLCDDPLAAAFAARCSQRQDGAAESILSCILAPNAPDVRGYYLAERSRIPPIQLRALEAAGIRSPEFQTRFMVVHYPNLSLLVFAQLAGERELASWLSLGRSPEAWLALRIPRQPDDAPLVEAVAKLALGCAPYDESVEHLHALVRMEGLPADSALIQAAFDGCRRALPRLHATANEWWTAFKTAAAGQSSAAGACRFEPAAPLEGFELQGVSLLLPSGSGINFWQIEERGEGCTCVVNIDSIDGGGCTRVALDASSLARHIVAAIARDVVLTHARLADLPRVWGVFPGHLVLAVVDTPFGRSQKDRLWDGARTAVEEATKALPASMPWLGRATIPVEADSEPRTCIGA